MKIKAFFDVVSGVLLDWRVIVTLVMMLFMMWAANFILKYKKKPRKKKEKAPKQEAPAKPAEEKKEEKEAESE